MYTKSSAVLKSNNVFSFTPNLNTFEKKNITKTKKSVQKYFYVVLANKTWKKLMTELSVCFVLNESLYIYNWIIWILFFKLFFKVREKVCEIAVTCF